MINTLVFLFQFAFVAFMGVICTACVGIMIYDTFINDINKKDKK